MSSRTLLGIILVVMVILALATPWPDRLNERYEVVQIAPLPGDTGSTAKKVNDFGQVAGYSYPSGEAYRGFLWDNGAMTDLGTLGGTYTRAYGINNLGQVVGYSYTAEGESRAFLWEDGVMTDLGTLGGTWSAAYCINDLGQVVGYSYNEQGRYRACFWEDGVLTDLGTLGGDNSVAFAINNRSQVVGRADTPEGDFHAFLWEKTGSPGCAGCGVQGVMTDLGTLGGENSDGWDINASGQVVGWSDLGTGEYRAFFWENGVLTDLGRFEGENSEARGLNNFGVAIGHAFTVDNDPQAFIWNRVELMNLNDERPPGFDGVLAFCNDINDAGVVVGSAFDGEDLEAFMLRPRPDPTLSRGALSPGLGYCGSLYTYRVDYFDANWHQPARLLINIDGADYDMILDSGSPTNGTYVYATPDISEGSFHHFYFYVEKDNGETCRLPAEGTFSGPVNRPPQASISGDPAPGAKMTLRVRGAAGGAWMAAWSSQPGPYEHAGTGLTFDIGPGDMHWIKKVFEEPIQLDEEGIGTIEFYIPTGMIPPGTKYFQGATRLNGLWAKTGQGSFIIN